MTGQILRLQRAEKRGKKWALTTLNVVCVLRECIQSFSEET